VMNPTKGNGPDAPHDRPAKTLSKFTADSIARAARFASAEPGHLALFAALVLQAALLVGVLQ